MANYFVICEITKLLKSDQERVRFLKTCKSFYRFRLEIRYEEFPIYYYLGNCLVKTSDTASDVVERKLENHKNMPSKFRSLVMHTRREIWETIRDPKFDIENLIVAHNEGYPSIEDYLRIRNLKSITFLSYDLPFSKDYRLPETITKLEFGYSFNQLLLKSNLPSNLKSIIFNYSFQKPIRSILPNTVKRLKLHYSYNEFIWGGDLPDSIKYLETPINNFEITNDIWPKNLKHLTILRFRGRLLENCFPETLITLDINSSEFNNLPPLPKTLKNLTLPYNFTSKIHKNVLPEGLKSLYLGQKFNQVIEDGCLPDSLERINFGMEFNKTNGLKYPKQLKVVSIGNDSFQLSSLPNYVQEVFLEYKYRASLLPNCLPNTLKKLYFQEDYCQSIHNNCIPDTVEHITLPIHDLIITTTSLPRDLKEVSLPYTSSLIDSFKEKNIKVDTFNYYT